MAGCAEPAPIPPPVPTASAAAPAATLLPGEEAPAKPAVATGPTFDIATVKPLLADARLSEAKIAIDAGKLQEATRAIQAVRKTLPDGGERAAFAYLEGVLSERAGMPEPALAAMKVASESEGPLRAHARLRIVDLSTALGRHREAVAAAKLITTGDGSSVTTARLDLALVEPLARSATVAEVEPVVRRLFAGTPRFAGWSRLAFVLAKAISNKPGLDATRLSLELADLVRFEANKGRGAEDAEKLATQLISRLPREEQAAQKNPSPSAKLARGEKLTASNQAKRALKLLDELEKKKLGELSAAEQCRLHRARGEALLQVKRKREGYDAYVSAVERCAGSDTLASALFDAGKAAQRAGLNAEAAVLFGRFEAAFPKHERADDARLEGAVANKEAGNTAAFKKLLGSIASDYPKGDRTRDGVFALAAHHLEAGAWAEAKELLTAGRALGAERTYYRAGRFSYYLGRAEVALGNADAGAKLYESVLLSAPLSYYAALAASRLESMEKGRAERVLGSAIAVENAPSTAPELPLEQAKDPRVIAAIALAQVGDQKGLDDALESLGVSAHTAEPAMLLLGARLTAIAGDAQGAHAILRTAREREGLGDRREVTELATELPRGSMRAVYELAFPRLFRSEFEAASKESGVPETVLFALSREESAFLPKALSVADARGLMQVIPATGAAAARKLGIKYKADTLFDPSANTRIGARYLAGLRRELGVASPLVFAGYNAGPGAPKKWLEERPGWDLDLWVENIPYTETRNYVKRVLSSVFAYQALYGQTSLGEIANCPLAVPR